MPQIQSVSFQVPQSPYDTSLGAQLNQFFISNPEITLLASTLTSRAVLTPRSLPVLVLFFYTGVQATFTLPGGISYKAYEFIGPQAEQEANALLTSDPSLQIWAYLNLRPVETRFTNIKKVILIVYKDDQCRQRKKKITYCTVYNNAAAIPFWGSGAVVFPDLPCPTANVLNLNTTTWAVRTPSFGIQAVNQLGQTALVTLGPSAAPG
ncbi:MAG: hypothetical protein RMK43_12765, partial [Cyclobacteriaceae bacterium]|nr:hypothetical protein [Cyclobacteriaceae bacterium]